MIDGPRSDAGERLDLSSLDPTRDGPKFDRIVGAIVADALAARTRDSEVPGVPGVPGVATPPRIVSAQIAQWWWPGLAAAACLMVATLPSLVSRTPARAARAPQTASAAVAAAIGIPAPFANALATGGTPSLGELLDGVGTASPSVQTSTP